MTIELYKNNSLKHTINKELESVVSLNCQLFDDSDISDPVLILKMDERIFSCNYVYIPKFQRYYFITSITVSEGKRVVVNCHVDVLESFKSEFMEQNVNIIRQEKVGNYYLNDPLLKVLQKKNIQILKLEQPNGNPFATSSYIDENAYMFAFETM